MYESMALNTLFLYSSVVFTPATIPNIKQCFVLFPSNSKHLLLGHTLLIYVVRWRESISKVLSTELTFSLIRFLKILLTLIRNEYRKIVRQTVLIFRQINKNKSTAPKYCFYYWFNLVIVFSLFISEINAVELGWFHIHFSAQTKMNLS